MPKGFSGKLLVMCDVDFNENGDVVKVTPCRDFAEKLHVVMGSDGKALLLEPNGAQQSIGSETTGQHERSQMFEPLPKEH